MKYLRYLLIVTLLGLVLTACTTVGGQMYQPSPEPLYRLCFIETREDIWRFLGFMSMFTTLMLHLATQWWSLSNSPDSMLLFERFIVVGIHTVYIWITSISFHIDNGMGITFSGTQDGELIME